MIISDIIICIIFSLPFIALFVIFVTGRSKPSQKYSASRDKFYILRKNFSFPSYIYMERDYETQDHILFIETKEASFKITEYVPGNIELGFMVAELYLREIYGDSITNITLPTTKYNWKDELQIHFKKREFSLSCCTETHESFDCSKR